MNPKPGYQSTEFYLVLLATLLAAAQPFLAELPAWANAVSSALAVLGALGYTAGRSRVKAAEAEAIARSRFEVETDSQMLLTGGEDTPDATSPTKRVGRPAPILLALLLPAALMAGCGLGPAPRQAVELLDRVAENDRAREAELRQLLGASWRQIAVMEHAEALREASFSRGAVGGDAVELNAAIASMEDLLRKLDRADKVLGGYAAEAAASAKLGGELRDRVAGALKALEERKAALEALGDSAVVAAGAVAAIEARKAKAREAEAEARLLEERRLEREAEEEGEE